MRRVVSSPIINKITESEARIKLHTTTDCLPVEYFQLSVYKQNLWKCTKHPVQWQLHNYTILEFFIPLESRAEIWRNC